MNVFGLKGKKKEQEKNDEVLKKYQDELMNNGRNVAMSTSQAVMPS